MAPQFKKLTDCPENLREAIDWLIQVRHGGDGENGEGLTKLSQALTILIQDAIDKARESIQHKQDKLDCSKEPSLGFTYCKKLDDQIKQAEEEIKMLHKGNKAKKDKLNAKINDIKTLKEDCIKSHYIDERRRYSLSQEIDDATEVVKKLEVFTNDLNNFKAGNNILSRLCSGLETFLGYKSGNYTGQGIVYGDCDRFRDAVLMFFHGVLDSVKQDETVTHYLDFRDCIESIKDNIYKGGIQFNEATELVREALEMWDADLQGKIDAVVKESDTGALYALKHNVKNNIVQVANLKSQPLDTVIDTLASTVIEGLEKSVNKVGKAIKWLDKSLQKQLKNEYEKIQMEVEHVKTNAQDDRWRMQMLKQSVDKVLGELDDGIYMNVTNNMDNMEITLRGSIMDIQEQVKKINALLKQYLEEFTEWITSAEKILVTALEKIEEILAGVKDGYKGNKGAKNNVTQITDKATEIQSKADKLHEAYEQAKRDVQQQAAAAVEAITGLESVYKEKLNDVKKKIDSAVDQATAGLKGLATKVNEGLTGLEQKINPQVARVVTALQSRIDEAGKTQSAATVIQEFHLGISGDDAPALRTWSGKVMNSSTLRSAIDGLQYIGGDFTKFQAVFKALSENEDGKGTFYQALIGDLQKKVKDAIHSVKNSDFQKVFSKFHEQITGRGGDTLKGEIEKIKTQFNDSFDKNGNIKTEDAVLTGYTTNQKALTAAIEACGTNSFVQPDEKISDIKKGTTFKNLLEEIKNELNNVAKLVDNDSSSPPDEQGLKQILTDLKNKKIKGNSTKAELTKIKEQFHTLQNENVGKLSAAVIKLLKQTLPDAVRDCKQAIQDYTREKVANVREYIKSETLKRYVTSKSNDLIKFNASVEERRKVMNRIIQDDLASGIKGLLRTMMNEIKQFQAFDTDLKLYEAASYMSEYFKQIMDAVKRQPDMKPVASNINKLNDLLTKLLDDLENSQHFDHIFSNNLQSLNDFLASLVPNGFSGPFSRPLEVIKEGINGLAGELRKTYVNKYEGVESSSAMMRVENKLTDDGKNCAKICLTVFSILFTNLSRLELKCAVGWNVEQINHSTAVGRFFAAQGYDVSDACEQNGELQDKESMRGENIRVLLNNYILFKRQKPDDAGDQSPLYEIYSCLHKFYEVCHLRIAISSNPIYPCSIYGMLLWLCGLPYNAMHDRLCDYFRQLFAKPKQYKNYEYSEIPISQLTLAATKNITYEDLLLSLRNVCAHSEKILVAILGHGHAGGRYACDFNTNPDKLSYPDDTSKCFDMLVEFLYRVYHQMCSLYKHCRYTTHLSGWRDCLYGKGVAGSAWQCNTLKCTECESATKCKEHPICGLKSPLQSFLEDGLPGFLPHPLKRPNCTITCDATNHFGIPCKTPMGFKDIGHVASHTSNGERIMNVLGQFCGDLDKPLTKICSYLGCLLHRPPRTLGDMFAFFFNYLYDWETKTEHKKAAFDKEVTDTHFGQPYTGFDISSIFHSSDHRSENHENGDLYSLFSCDNKKTPSYPCGPYIKSVSQDILDIFSSSHKKYYLSWVVYLTETFYDLLNQLYNECSEQCKSPGSRCYDKTCAANCLAPHTLNKSLSFQHEDACISIVKCGSTLPTLCRYGLYLGSATWLSGIRGNKVKRTCSDFCKTLERVCHGKSVLAELVHVKIPAFLWAIREKFFYTVVALWLLSLFYLLHIMVIRLDLLHIKSHLHSPSSHRIAAQSLLAAARVGKLAKLTYLQP